MSKSISEDWKHTRSKDELIEFWAEKMKKAAKKEDHGKPRLEGVDVIEYCQKMITKIRGLDGENFK